MDQQTQPEIAKVHGTNYNSISVAVIESSLRFRLQLFVTIINVGGVQMARFTKSKEGTLLGISENAFRSKLSLNFDKEPF